MDNLGMEKSSSVVTLQGDNLNFNSTLKLTEANGKSKPKNELDNYDPFANRDMTHATPDSGALLHLLKSSLGSGILAMPNAFKNGGLGFGIIGTVIVGIICTHCVQMLVIRDLLLERKKEKYYVIWLSQYLYSVEELMEEMF